MSPPGATPFPGAPADPVAPAPCADGAAQADPLGPGTMILVVGPSGAGKDTLLSVARAQLARGSDARAGRLLFARRLVTRPQGSGEAHGTLTDAEFEASCASGRFPLSWRAHGLGYALGPEVAETIRDGGLVVANGSRATLPEARRRFAALVVVLVSAPVELRALRLAARGREDPAAIRERLGRTPEMVLSPDLEIENTGTPEEGGALLADFIRTRLTN